MLVLSIWIGIIPEVTDGTAYGLRGEKAAEMPSMFWDAVESQAASGS